jgi:isopenicillin N synthase-like dioxygenase
MRRRRIGVQRMSVKQARAIPRIEIGALFGPASPARAAADRAIAAAAADTGFMTVCGLPPEIPLDRATRRDLLRIFDLPEAEKRKLWRQKFDPARPNVYRGWFPVQPGDATYKDGIDIGPDLAHGPAVVDATDVLCGATPLPPEDALPGWRAVAASYYRAMAATGAALMRSIARGLGLAEDTFDAAFCGGISTLRLIRYPLRPESALAATDPELLWTVHEGVRRQLVGRPHVDSGFVTLLAHDGVAGLQARMREGTWVDVPPDEGTLAVNFGRVLERWTGGRIKATEHRVLGVGRERFSIPFFYEPRADAEIAPLPLADVAPFEPFLYGDHLWAASTRFVEFRGLEHLRKPRRPGAGQGLVPVAPY